MPRPSSKKFQPSPFQPKGGGIAPVATNGASPKHAVGDTRLMTVADESVDRYFTVRSALVLVALPAALLTLTEKSEPLSAGTVDGVV
jgi:hypothetical protein